jgi:LuxR family maltose regulon positive regulatory protein
VGSLFRNQVFLQAQRQKPGFWPAPTLGQSVVAALQSSQPLAIQALLTTLINEIAPMPERFALVLDDYHLITAQPLHDGLAFLLDHLPS